jgi:hypothetical protein
MRRTRFVAAGALAMLALTAVPAAAAPVSHLDGSMPALVGKTVFDADKEVPLGTRLLLVDGTGQHRKVIWPANWRVCKQDPAAGAPLTPSTAVTLVVVKLEEKCP